MTIPTFPCIACGAPVPAESGQTRLSCPYCGVMLTIPASLQTKAGPVPAVAQTKMPPPETAAVDILRKAQPLAVKAFNLYAYWTWLRWLLPTCLTLLVIGCIACAALGALPSVLGLFR